MKKKTFPKGTRENFIEGIHVEERYQTFCPYCQYEGILQELSLLEIEKP